MVRKLTPKEERFCQEIVRGENQSDAYRLAYKPKKAKPKSIHEKASQIMAQIKVQSRIAELRKPIVESLQADRMRWLQEIQRCAFYDVRHLLDANGNIKDFSEVSDEAMPMVAGLEVLEEFSGRGNDKERIGFTKKVKLVDRIAALTLFGKATGYYSENKQPPRSPLDEVATVVLVEMLKTLEAKQALKALPVGVEVEPTAR